MTNNGKLWELGVRLRNERIKRRDTQAMFAGRIGVSIPTLRKMESGDPTVQIGTWVMALEIFERTHDLDGLLSVPEDLFAKYDQMQSPQRKRASRSRR